MCFRQKKTNPEGLVFADSGGGMRTDLKDQ